jgi:GT2 family glycosyltransferase/peptidoglycan/xylan/chitin deacetylase (PgdA/CDA1 family)
MGSDTYRFSVVVPTHDRRDLLLDGLAAIAAARRRWPCELVVVDDGSTDGTAAALRDLRVPLPVTVLSQPNSGAARARNRGAAAATGTHLLFLDDDMVADRDLLLEIDATLRTGADVVLGHFPLHPGSPSGLLSRGVDRWTRNRCRRLASSSRLGLGDLLSGQLTIRAALFRQVGGFDEALTAHGVFGGEDTDLLYRLLQSGAVVRFNPRAISAQRYVVDARRHLRQWTEAGRADAALAAKHPGLGERLYRQHHGGTVRGLLGRSAARLPERLVRPGGDWVVRRVERGRQDRLTEYGYHGFRRIGYWRGAAERGGLRRGDDTRVRLLAYHMIGEVPDDRLARYAVPPDRLAAQLSALVAAGYRFIGPDDLADHLDGRPLHPGSVLVTFDDGYRSVADLGRPILRRFGIRPVLCVVTGQVGGTNEWDARTGTARLPLLDADRLGALARAGWEIAAHTATHAHLRTLSPGRLRAEIAGSRRAVERLGLPAPRFLAYPYGEHDRRVRAATARAGFRAGLALGTRAAHPDPADRFAIPRVEVRSDTTPDALVGALGGPVGPAPAPASAYRPAGTPVTVTFEQGRGLR